MDSLDLDFYAITRAFLFFALVGLMVFFEYFFSCHHLGKAGVRKRRINNWCLGIVNIIVAFPLSTLTAAAYCEYYQIGLFNLLKMPFWLVFILWFIMYDLYVYLFHRLSHVTSLWHFHKIHHSDKSLNVTTSFRFHPIEYVLFNVLKIVLIMLLGPYFFVLLISDFIQAVLVFWGHSNIGLNVKLERALSRIIITPRYHVLHHTQDECRRNYTSGLTLWDYLFHTHTEPIWNKEDINKLTLGIRTKTNDIEFKNLLLINKLIHFVGKPQFVYFKFPLITIGIVITFGIVEFY
ncbi:sterol desaturase family protein [Legionella pneumophila]|uniref:Sterol desaturase n=1 Tax=Legionella pneumophila subsp. pascullei TaxID=91890 RepID=A0AAX2ISK7_LEGPN|nr:sterol desaturase family protein [Legionella pneumophila]AMP88213.1 sterol desaturase [Legionella pneumophila subsp. pascullei]AMP91122.1 sterol desaturase [Legionella pneumophila subsp. pascullei]AMP94109.1 sterol desaturase [Legionella pneumophila subsp. pascullei]SQG88883.1 putative sterol desaturase [Legionella pneumophila subsp. pascullei]VEH03933.1 putative sterol desaturase [Legionella pneumophila subsp. pascullei]